MPNSAVATATTSPTTGLGPIRIPAPFAPPFDPVNFPDGTLVKASGPEVDMIQDQKRRHVPDTQTFDYMGLNWAAVQTVPDAVWASIPVGPPLPSRADGTLLKGSGPEIYLMKNGQRDWIADPLTFVTLGLNWAAVQTVADADLNAIPFGPQADYPGPSPFADGTLIIASTPEVDIIQGHERRHIPDPTTLNYMGLDWGSIVKISDAIWAIIPVGPSLPSRADRTILKGSGPEVYFMQSGKRHLVPDQATFDSMGLNSLPIENASDSDLNAIPLGAPVPEGGFPPAFPITASQDDNFPGSGGFMHTDATIYSSGLMNAVTHTWEVTDLRGFRGSVAVALLAQNGTPIWVSATQNFGVDGRWIGTSDRFDNWNDNVPGVILPNVRYIAIIQKWNPNSLFDDIGKWLSGVTNVFNELGSAIQAVKTVASLF